MLLQLPRSHARSQMPRLLVLILGLTLTTLLAACGGAPEPEGGGGPSGGQTPPPSRQPPSGGAQPDRAQPDRAQPTAAPRPGSSNAARTFDLARLQATSWQLSALDGEAVPSDLTVTMLVRGRQVFGNVGANSYSGALSQSAGRLKIGPIVTTDESIPPAAAALQSRVLSAFGAVDGATQRGDDLILLQGESERMVFERAQ